MSGDDEIFAFLVSIQKSLKRLEDDMDWVKKTLVADAKLDKKELEEIESLELDKEMADLLKAKALDEKPVDRDANQRRYHEETLEEAEKRLG